MDLSKNISKTFDLAIDSIDFSDSSGSLFYALTSKDIRKLDLSAETISKPLASGVIEFEVNIDSNVIIYIANGQEGTNERVVGLYHDGDDNAHQIKTIKSTSEVQLHATATSYFNEDFIAIAEGENVHVLGLDFEGMSDEASENIKTIVSFSTKYAIKNIGFSPSGEYVLVQSDGDFASYDLEYQKLTASNLGCTSVINPVLWLDENHLWSSCDGTVSLREFDGSNVFKINPALDGQSVTLTRNGRFLYSLNKNSTGYQLQRVRMILP